MSGKFTCIPCTPFPRRLLVLIDVAIEPPFCSQERPFTSPTLLFPYEAPARFFVNVVTHSWQRWRAQWGHSNAVRPRLAPQTSHLTFFRCWILAQNSECRQVENFSSSVTAPARSHRACCPWVSWSKRTFRRASVEAFSACLASCLSSCCLAILSLRLFIHARSCSLSFCLASAFSCLRRASCHPLPCSVA